MIKGVADQFAIEQVLYPRQVKPAFISGHVRYIGDPDTVRSRYNKLLPVKQVRGYWQLMPVIRGHVEFPFLPTAQPQFAAGRKPSIRSYITATPSRNTPRRKSSLGTQQFF